MHCDCTVTFFRDRSAWKDCSITRHEHQCSGWPPSWAQHVWAQDTCSRCHQHLAELPSAGTSYCQQRQFRQRSTATTAAKSTSTWAGPSRQFELHRVGERTRPSSSMVQRIRNRKHQRQHKAYLCRFAVQTSSALCTVMCCCVFDMQSASCKQQQPASWSSGGYPCSCRC